MNRRHFLRNGLWVTGAAIGFPAIVRAQVMPSARRIAAPMVGETYQISEDCENASTPSGWTDSGVEWGASPALIGDGSLVADAAADATYHAFAGSAVWVFCAFSLSAITASVTQVIRLYAADGVTMVGRFGVTSTGAIRVYSGSDSSTSAGGLVAINTTYFVWFFYQVGTGANSIGNAYLSDNQTKPASPTLAKSNGNGTENVARLTLNSGAASTTVTWDKIRASTSAIGSDPT